MNITYQREVGHCQVSPYVKLVTIDTITPAENSDNLERLTFKELGWNAICQKGLHCVGKQVMFIPAESVLPFELSELLDVTKYLSKGRVKVTKLRGNRSEGLIVPTDIIEPFLPFIMKWEDLPSITMAGDLVSPSEISIDFVSFYKMPNILNEPQTFFTKEELYWSEKIHGTNFRFGIFENPITLEYDEYVGSHNCVLKPSDKNIYWQIYYKYFNHKEFPADIEFFGEIYGKGIQDLHYNTEPTVKIFAATRKGRYISVDELRQLGGAFNLPIVKFHKITFESIDQLREIADRPSEITENGIEYIREGIVLVSKNFPEKMAKCISFNYLTRGGKKKTERH